MGKERFSVLGKLKAAASWLGWRLFLWGIDKTDEEYWAEIYTEGKASALDSVLALCVDTGVEI